MKSAIVTGSTKGIGLAAARLLAERGYWVLATGRDADAGKAVGEELSKDNRGEFLAADVSDPQVPSQLVDHVVERTGRLDLVVNNAGINIQEDVATATAEVMDRVLATNLRAPTLLAGAAIRWMREHGGGTVINVSSEAGVLGFPGQVAYNVSKAGLTQLTRSIVADHAADGVRSVTVSPGTTSTPLVQGLIDGAADQAAMRAALEDRPAGRLGTPEEIAEVIVFAASDAATYLTGSEIVADGGRTSVG